MLAQFLNVNVFDFVLVFARLGSAFMLAPVFSAAYVPTRIRLAGALAMAFVVFPVVAGTIPPPPASAAGVVLIITGEVVIGAFLGTVAAILLAIVQITGTVLSFVASLANAFIQDPISQVQSSVLANFFSIVAATLIIVTDLHHLMIRSWVDSYSLFLPGQALPVSDWALLMSRYVSDVFNIGVNLAAPFLIVGLTYYVGIGLLSRLMPALPVFFVGLPIQIAVQVFTMSVALPMMMLVFLREFEDHLIQFLAP